MVILDGTVWGLSEMMAMKLISKPLCSAHILGITIIIPRNLKYQLPADQLPFLYKSLLCPYHHTGVDLGNQLGKVPALAKLTFSKWTKYIQASF